MALEDRGLDTEQYVEFENLSPYSNTSGYSDPPAYYHSEYEWQQQQQPPPPLHHQQQSIGNHPHQQLQHPHSVMESERQFFSPYQTSTSGVSNHTAYPPYPQHQGTTGPDCYQPASALWVPSTTSLGGSQMHPAHRFFSGIDLSQQTRSPQNGGSSGVTGKPKRKRVQSLTQRKAANVRERRRMFHLNEAFDELRKRLPAFNYEKRLSRIETLRLAMTYISFMKDVSVGTDPKSVKLKPHGSDLDDSSISFMGRGSFSDQGAGDGDESDGSVDEHSNHSGGN